MAAILERRGEIERALRKVQLDASLADATTSIPWIPPDAALRRVRGYSRGWFLEDDEGAAHETAGAVQRELASRTYRLTEVRILDLLIWSVSAAN
jgi:hypothetical protein